MIEYGVGIICHAICLLSGFAPKRFKGYLIIVCGIAIWGSAHCGR
jgi:hypothetical protein